MFTHDQCRRLRASILIGGQKSAWLAFAFLIRGILGPETLRAAEVSRYIALTTDYVFRGVTYSDGHPAAQLGLDVEFDTGFYAGAWASTIDINNGPGRQRDAEVTYYAGYTVEATSDWSVGISLIAHTYPGATGTIDYDYEEWSLSANFADRAWIEYSYSDDLYNAGSTTHNVDIYAEYPLPRNFSAGAGVGYYDVSNLAGDGYAYWQLGISKPVGRFALDLRYHDTSRWVRIVSTDDRAEPRVAFSIRLTF